MDWWLIPQPWWNLASIQSSRLRTAASVPFWFVPPAGYAQHGHRPHLGFRAASDRGILQRAQDTPDEDIAMTPATHVVRNQRGWTQDSVPATIDP